MQKDPCVPDEHGNCQHISLRGESSYSIPFGTHMFGGSSVVMSLSPGDLPIEHHDDRLAHDLLDILSNCGHLEDSGSLMQKLVLYITERDGKVLQHGIAVGRTMQPPSQAL